MNTNTVSVVIPVKNSQSTIRRTVESLLAQRFDGQIEIILVGDQNDSTWNPIRDLINGRNVKIIETRIKSAKRDANAKRNVGLKAASGNIIALTDSDMVMPPNWVAKSVELLDRYECVAGSMVTAADIMGFWGEYMDKVQIGSKTPRMDPAYLLTRENFGIGRHTPPVTANMVFHRSVVDKGVLLDADFVWDYEDYEWAFRLVNAGIDIYCTNELWAEHYHRPGWKNIRKDFSNSGQGCADFVFKFPNVPFSKKRVIQYVVFTGAILFAFGVLLLNILFALFVGTLGVLVLTALGFKNARDTNYRPAVVFPFVTLFSAIMFCWGFTLGIKRNIEGRPATFVTILNERNI